MQGFLCVRAFRVSWGFGFYEVLGLVGLRFFGDGLGLVFIIYSLGFWVL